jgi:hypothetical protein
VSSTNPAQNVQFDPEKAKKMTIYFAAVTAVGVAIIVLTVMQGWGFMGYLGGGVLLVSGAGGYAGLKATGGVGKVTCPKCQVQTEVMQLKVHRYLACPGCNTWLEGAMDMKPVAAGHIAPNPTFSTPLPTGEVTWPKAADGSFRNPSGSDRNCTELKEIEGTRSSALALVAPVSVQRVLKLQVPWRADDDNAVWLSLDPVPTIAFRSFDYLQAFKRVNLIG